MLGRSLEQVLHGCLTHGPPLELGGFFYDVFAGEAKVHEADYPKIEAKAQELVAQNAPFEKLVLSKQEALDTYNAYAVNGMPQVALIDRKGMVRMIDVGGDKGAATVETMLKKLIAEK